MDRNLHQRITHCVTAIALAMVVSLVLAGAARADASQWQIKQPHWWDVAGGGAGAGGQQNGWSGQHNWSSQHMSGQQWPGQHWPGQGSGQWHHHNQFNDGIHRCFGSCFGSRFVFNGRNVFFASPGVVFGSPGFVIRQPSFIIRQPSFIIRQPGFVIGGPVIVTRQPMFFGHHHSPHFIRPGQPMHHHGNGVRIIVPGM